MIIAGLLLGVMSIVDTLSYGVRTAGVSTKRLAISLSLFNIIVIVSRLSNMAVMPVLGNFPDKVFKSAYTAQQVLAALRIDLVFVVGGVILGGLLTPSFIKITKRGIEVLEDKGSLPPTIWYGLVRFWRLPKYFCFPSLARTKDYLDYRTIPLKFLIFNIFVTCFYSIGVMSTILAASWDHSVAVTTAMLSGIVNGIATLLLFGIVDPPAAVLVDNCIVGKRPEAHAKTMNLYLVLTRLTGCMLAIALLPLMANYVLSAAHWVDRVFTSSPAEAVLIGQVETEHDGISYTFSVDQSGNAANFKLVIENQREASVDFEYVSGAKFDFAVVTEGNTVWSRNSGLRFTQALETTTLNPGARLFFSGQWQPPPGFLPPGSSPLVFEARHLWSGNETTLGFEIPWESW